MVDYSLVDGLDDDVELPASKNVGSLEGVAEIFAKLGTWVFCAMP